MAWLRTKSDFFKHLILWCLQKPKLHRLLWNMHIYLRYFFNSLRSNLYKFNLQLLMLFSILIFKPNSYSYYEFSACGNRDFYFKNLPAFENYFPNQKIVNLTIKVKKKQQAKRIKKWIYESDGCLLETYVFNHLLIFIFQINLYQP